MRHGRAPGDGEVEAAADGAQHFAMLPPELGGVAVVVPLVHHGVEGGVELAVPELVGEMQAGEDGNTGGVGGRRLLPNRQSTSHRATGGRTARRPAAT